MKLGIKWGVLLGAIIVIITQMLTWLGLGTSNWFVILTFISVILVAILFARKARTNFPDNSKALNWILPLLATIIISRYIFQAYMFIYIQFVDPSWVSTVSETWSAMLADQNFTTEQIENQISAFQKSYRPTQMFTIEIVKYGIPQFIIALIVLWFYFWRTK